MKTIEIMAIGVRLLGIYLIFQALQFGAQGISGYSTYSFTGSELDLTAFSATYIMFFSLLTISGFGLIFLPVSVAKLLVSHSDSDSPALVGDSNDIQRIVLSLLGVYILSWAIPDLAYNIAVLALLTDQAEHGMIDRSGYFIDLGVTCIELAIGSFLAFRSNGLHQFLVRIRELGSGG